MKASISEPTATDPLPPPTDVLPGPAKVEVMAARYAAGQFIWNELDATGGTSEPHRPGRGGSWRDRICTEEDAFEKIPQSLRDRLGKHALGLIDTVGPRP